VTAHTSEGIRTLLVPVSDPALAKGVYAALLGAAPQVDETTYVGFGAGGQHIELLPQGGPQGITAPLPYRQVFDLDAAMADLTAAGADGNAIGLAQNA
jgi:hypothetical protein